jgi:hypothetical protein
MTHQDDPPETIAPETVPCESAVTLLREVQRSPGARSEFMRQYLTTCSRDKGGPNKGVPGMNPKDRGTCERLRKFARDWRAAHGLPPVPWCAEANAG